MYVFFVSWFNCLNSVPATVAQENVSDMEREISEQTSAPLWCTVMPWGSDLSSASHGAIVSLLLPPHLVLSITGSCESACEGIS